MVKGPRRSRGAVGPRTPDSIRTGIGTGTGIRTDTGTRAGSRTRTGIRTSGTTRQKTDDRHHLTEDSRTTRKEARTP